MSVLAVVATGCAGASDVADNPGADEAEVAELYGLEAPFDQELADMLLQDVRDKGVLAGQFQVGPRSSSTPHLGRCDKKTIRVGRRLGGAP